MSGFSRSRCVVASVFLFLFAVAAAPVQAQLTRLAVPATTLAPALPVPADLTLDVLNVLPENTLGFVTAHHLLDTKTTVENVLKKLTIPYDAGNDYAEFEEFVASLKGWDDKGTHALALFAVAEQKEPDVAVFVPVKNYKEFAASLGADVAGEAPTEFKVEDGPKGWIVAKGNYAVLTEPGDDGLALLETILKSNKSLTEARGPLRRWIGEYQVAAVVTRAGTDKIIDEVLKGLEEVKKDFAENKDEEIVGQAAQVIAIFDMYGKILESLRDDVTHLAVGGNLSETTGLHLAGEALFLPNGKFAEVTKNFTPLSADALNGLPDDRFFMAGAGTLPTELAESLMNFSFGMYKNMPKDQGGLQLDEADLKKLTELSTASMKGVKQFSMTFGAQGQGMLGGIVALYRVEDSAAFMTNYETAMKSVQELSKKADSPLLPQQVLEHRKVDDLDVLAVTIDISKQFDQLGAGQPLPVKKIVESMFGGNGTITGYLVAAGNDTVVMTYDEKMLTQVVADVKAKKAGLGGNVNLQKTAAMLPQKLQWVGYLDVGGAVDFGKKMADAAMAAQGQGGFPIPIPPFPNVAPIGAAGRINGTALEGHFVVPMDLMEGVRDYVQQVSQMFGGGLR